MLDDRLKRFRMLDTEEFQEMLKSMSQQQSSEQPTGFNNMDTIDGIQLESKFQIKDFQLFISRSIRRLLVA